MTDLLREQFNIENELAVEEVLTEEISANKGMLEIGIEKYTYHTKKIKDEVDQIAAEIEQRQERIKLMHELIQVFNRLNHAETGVDLSNEPEIQKKLDVARKLGVQIPGDQLSFDSRESGYIIENLHLSADDCDRDNKTQAQKMQVLIQESDRLMMLANFLVKSAHRMKRTVLEAMR